MLEWMVLPFKRYAEFSGRSRRMEYWSFALLNFLVSFVLMALLMTSGVPIATMGQDPTAMKAAGGILWLVMGLAIIYSFAVLIPGLAVAVRRLHDRDLSGWWLLGFFVGYMIPLINFFVGIAFLVIMLLPGTPGPNRFGPDPKDPASAEVFA